ncbi:MAG: trehalose-6-phosphate synthase [Rhodospirillales bacterium 70-18]|nr:trehalose-6-phosphate synthase [Rhodospirillales bacterium]OJY74645.1 MAG: trehalose-6-phosphate synthase [Rhodospirillales bacterium 70-18]
MSRLIIVSNRVPRPRERTQPAGGLAIALNEAIRTRETMWFGWSGAHDGAAGPGPQVVTQGNVTFATIDIPATAFRGYYEGYSNSTLWPLLHSRVGLTLFRREDQAAYRAVNAQFADALVGLLRPDDTIWVHDYQLIPLGRMLRDRGVTRRIGFFLHVPFPAPQLFDCLPQAGELLADLGCYDVIGMQTQTDADNLNAMLSAQGVAVRARAYPIGIDPVAFAAAARRAAAGPEARRLLDSLAGRALILGVDRLDYSKGLPERLAGYERLLRRFPEHHARVTMLQIAPVSRGDVSQYRTLRRELYEMAGRINGEHADVDWMPLRFLTRTVSRATLAGYLRLARVGLVTPLRDGMNLVAKEYVAAQDPENPGALVLSRFAGAAQELSDAILINPYDPDEIAEALHLALTMGAAERIRGWQRMNAAVLGNTAADWARRFLGDLER